MSDFINLMLQYQWIFICLSFIFAAAIGSFLNVVIHRLPVMLKREWQQECSAYLKEYQEKSLSESQLSAFEASIDNYPEKYNLITPSSACPKCRTSIKPWQNIPIIGYLMLRGKCANCHEKISTRYPIVEALTGIMVSTLAWHLGPTLAFVYATILTFALIALTFIDLDEMLLPDQITQPLLWLGLIINIKGTFASLPDAIIGAVAGYLSLWAIFWLFKLLTGKEGMGYGDFKLLAVFGAWLGWQALPLTILLSSLIGAIVGFALITSKKLNMGNPIPFGPYIALAGWISMLWGSTILDWYLVNFLGY